MSLRLSARTEVRRSRYKVSGGATLPLTLALAEVTVDAEEGRRRREDKMEEIQKSRREENLMKKRREGLQNQQLQPTVNVPQLDKKVLVDNQSFGESSSNGGWVLVKQ